MRIIDKVKAYLDRYTEGRHYPMQETFKLGMRGFWQDKYVYQDGRVITMPWRRNQVQNVAPIVAASLFRRAGETAFPGFVGISYMVVGSGLVAWDTTPPTQDAADTTLTTEVFRKAVLESDMFFLDPPAALGSAAVVGPTRKIGITATIDTTEALTSLREFGLFAGLATGTVDTGSVVNWVVHPLVNHDSSFSIVRTVELEFLEP